MTQPSTVLLRERVKEHIQAEKRDTIASGLASMGIEVVVGFLLNVGVFLETEMGELLEIYLFVLHIVI